MEMNSSKLGSRDWPLTCRLHWTSLCWFTTSGVTPTYEMEVWSDLHASDCQGHREGFRSFRNTHPNFEGGGESPKSHDPEGNPCHMHHREPQQLPSPCENKTINLWRNNRSFGECSKCYNCWLLIVHYGCSCWPSWLYPLSLSLRWKIQTIHLVEKKYGTMGYLIMMEI